MMVITAEAITHQQRVEDANKAHKDADNVHTYSGRLIEGQSRHINNDWQP